MTGLTELRFCDLPDAKRMAFRDAIDIAGGQIEGYCGADVQVSIPSPSGPFFEAMELAGLELIESSVYLFPLGSDSPPQHMRHDGRYKGSKGFWLYARFTPAP